MSGEPLITVVGNATADAELRFLPSGVAVCNFTVAQTPRTKQGEQWVDGETMFFRVATWRDMAEHAAETIRRGMRVIVTGRMKVRSYTPDGGTERQSMEIDADEVGVAIRFGTATFNKAERSGPGQAPPAHDPWATAPATAPGWGTAPPAAAPPGWSAPAPSGPPAAPPPSGWGPPPGYAEPPY